MTGREVYAIVGVMMLLFGVGWLAYAAVQPVGIDNCSSQNGVYYQAACLDLAAKVFYLLGGASVGGGVLFLVLGGTGRTSTTAISDRTKG